MRVISKDVLHQTISDPIHSGTKTSWPLTFSESLGRAGQTGGDGSVGYARGGDKEMRREEMGGEGRGGEERGGCSRKGYKGRGDERNGWDAMVEEWKGRT